MGESSLILQGLMHHTWQYKESQTDPLPPASAIPPTRLSGTEHCYFHHGDEMAELTASPSIHAP